MPGDLKNDIGQQAEAFAKAYNAHDLKVAYDDQRETPRRWRPPNET